MEDIFAVQDEISLLIADKLREHIGHFDIEKHLVESPNIPVEVYKKYLKGRYYMMKLTLSGTEKSILIFKEVISEQPQFPLPYLGINQGYAFLGTMGLLPAPESFAKAKPFLDKALTLDKELPESQLNLTWIACWQNWDIESAYRHINKALELRPSDVILLTMSNILTVEGKLDAAQNYIDKALQLDPFSAMNHHYKGFLFYLQGKYEKALPYLEKSLQLKPDLPFPHIYMGAIPLLTGQASDGLTFFQNLPENEGGDLTKLGGTTLAYAALEDDNKTADGIAKLEAALDTDSMGSAMQFLILVKTMMKKYDEAIQLIEQAVRYRLPLALLIYTDPILKPLHSIARFQELMQQIYGKKSNIDFSKRKYKKPLFNEALLKKYQHQLEALMANEKPYLDPGLTIRSLAKILEIPSNHLSQLLSEGFDKNFSEFVNTYRLEAFKSKAADPSQQHLTLLALAYDSGFNSKTVFNTFFKKMMGKTPKAYWKEVVK
jgi:tetratricopeptide (TPR) repeat protein